MQSIPHHGNNEEGEYLLDLRVGHKCNGSPQKLTNGASPTWCAKERKKHKKVGGMIG
jgi:hypothetical protein